MIRSFGMLSLSFFVMVGVGCTKQDPLAGKEKEIRDARFPEQKPIEDLSRFPAEVVQLDVSGSQSFSVLEGEELKLALRPRILDESLANLDWVVDMLDLPESNARFSWSQDAAEFTWTPSSEFLGGNLVKPVLLSFVVRSNLNPRLFKAFTFQAHALQKLDSQPKVLSLTWPRGIDSAVSEGTSVRGTLTFQDFESSLAPIIPGRVPKVVIVSAGSTLRFLGNRATVDNLRAVAARPQVFEADIVFNLAGYDVEPPAPSGGVIRNQKIQFGLIVYSSTGYPSDVHPVELLVENRIKDPQMSGGGSAETVARGTQSTTWFQSFNASNESILSLKEVRGCNTARGMNCGCEPKSVGNLPSRVLNCFVRWTPSLTATEYLHSVSFVIESRNPAVDATQGPIETVFGRNFATTPLPPSSPNPPNETNSQNRGLMPAHKNISSGGSL